MKSGDWVKINFLGRVKSTGEVFDLTVEEDAKKHGIHEEGKKYGPVLVIIGGGMIMRGVESELLKMKIGQKKSFEVPSSEALGPRRAELIRVISIAKFVQKNINPFPGMWVNVDGRNCKVLFVSGGRVRVDFNHPLAGKDLTYDLEITEEIKGTRKRVEALLDYYGVKGKLAITGKKARVSLEKEIGPLTEKLIEETLKKWCPGIDTVSFRQPKKPAGKVPGAGKPAAPAGGQAKT
jgi:FKBP-type peptidyl-prolyl cis-trans isomerase 2